MAIAEGIEPGTGERSEYPGWRLLWWAVCSQGCGAPAGMVAGVVWMLGAVSAPAVLSRAIDEGIIGGDGRRLGGWIALLIGLGMVEAGAGAVRHYFAVRNGQGTAAAVRARLLEHFQRLDESFYNRWPAGQLLSRSSSDAVWVGTFVDVLAHSSGYVVAVAVVAVFLVLIDPLLALITLLPLPLISVATWRYSARYRKQAHELQEELARAATVSEDTISGIRAVKGLRAEDAQRSRFRSHTERIRERALNVARLDAIFEPVMNAIPSIGLLTVVWLGGYFALSGRITLGQLVGFYAYVVLLVTPLRTLGVRVGTVQRALAAAERISELLSIRPHVAEPQNPLPIPITGRGYPLRGEVRLKEVSFGYETNGPYVLDGLDLSVPAGSRLAIVGATGEGKSTLAHLLSRRYDVSAGQVLLDGVNVRDLRLSELRGAVVVVSERPFLFTDTVRANIAFARPQACLEEIQRAARLAGAHGFISELPNGYDTMLEERGLSLSGGQRQRLALARAILAEPRLLVLDDATSAVDAETEREIRAGLETALVGRTALIISRRPGTIALADRVVLLEGGRAAAEGTPEELVNTSELYRDLILGEPAVPAGVMR